ncbi:four helix bundle protein [Candidatus Peregrinibacteria bacterium]|nr:four helix bundle protein [Candidatus Peregrinibacteria bacterium]
MHSYRDLIVWQRAMDLVVEIYKLTSQFPKEELYSLTSQIRRAAISIPSNIAEGRFRGTKSDYSHFLRYAYASGAELETQLEISKRLSFRTPVEFEKSDRYLEECMRMLNVMIRNLNPSGA